MAIKTQFSAQELSDILNSYDLGEYIDSRGFMYGADQTNILLITSKGKYAFRYYEKRSEDYVRFEIDLLRFLVEKRYPCPAPIQRRDNSFIGTYKNKPYAVFNYLEGEHSEDKDNYKLVAAIIGRLHTLTTRQMPVHFGTRSSYDTDYVWSFAKLNARKIHSESEAQARLGWLRGELETVQLPADLPKGVCHCDSNPTNFLYENGEISAVLDFDQAGYTSLLYDVAQMIYCWTWPNKGNIELNKARDLVTRYESVRKLHNVEKEHLFDALKMVHLVGIGWFLSSDSFSNDKRKVVDLNVLGRDEFYKALFEL